MAILDGTNISRDRRKIISDKISALKDKGYDILWIESSSVRGDDVSEQQFEELKNSPDFLDKVHSASPPTSPSSLYSAIPATPSYCHRVHEGFALPNTSPLLCKVSLLLSIHMFVKYTIQQTNFLLPPPSVASCLSVCLRMTISVRWPCTETATSPSRKRRAAS